MSRRFTASYPVRFGEIDHAGVMYYPALFDRTHRAFEDFWQEAVGKSYAEVLTKDGIGFPLIDVHSTFTAPFRFGDTIRVCISIVKIGTKSLTLRVRLAAEGEEEHRAEMTLITGVIAMESFESVPLPEAYRRALTPYLLPED